MDTKKVDVLIVGAGISGIGTAYHLQKNCPDKTYAIIEARNAIGGTWDLFRYPGIRSDSDMYSFGYVFKAWESAKIISPGDDIRAYINEAAQENGIDKHIQFQAKLHKANWDSKTARWTSQIHNLATGETEQIVSQFLLTCCGYYDYDQGYTPEFAGRDSFKGSIVHPQHWPQDLDYSDKKVIIIGSGATAVTLAPNLAKKASQTTILQRSPTYIANRAQDDVFANFMRRILPKKMAYWVIRWQNILYGMYLYFMAQKLSSVFKNSIRKHIVEQLGEDYDVDKHFNPSYKPWDQRLCLVPDNDLFLAIKNGSVDMVTDHIESFTPNGIKLKSGEELTADIIVTATGLNMKVLSGIEFSVDDKDIKVAEQFCYKGMMLSEMPNFALTMGYTNASWTLKADLVAQYTCRLINHLDETNNDYFMPTKPEEGIDEVPFFTLSAGYVQRSSGQTPKISSTKPWCLNQNYLLDKFALGKKSVEDDSIVFARAKVQES